MNSYHYGRKEFHLSREENTAAIVTFIGLIAGSLVLYVLNKRLYVRPEQLVEISIDVACLALGIYITYRYFRHFKKRRLEAWPHPPVHIPLLKDRQYVRTAFARNSVIGGYSVENQPWYWSDDIRRMQALLLGMSGSGKTTHLLNIIGQDLRRVVRGNHRIPIIIIDAKADKDFRRRLQYEVAAAGRSHQLRILDPSHPEISAHWNPLFITDDSYYEHVNFIFESFGFRHEFFKGHQANYFGDLVRILHYTGKRINIRDVLVMALDEKVLEEEIERARQRLGKLFGPDDERRLNFEMSVYSLQKSLLDRDRVEKIRGLLNELMTFLEDKLSVITGPYEDLLTLQDVIDQELILYVSLNFSRNSRAVTSLGKMLLHNLELLIGKRYEEREDAPFVSVFLDEFSPIAYPNFAHVIQTARGSNIGILFSLQSITQLERVSLAFAKDVATAPNTVMLLRCTHDEETAKYFMSSSSLVEAKRRTMTVEESGFLDKQVNEIGFGSYTDIKEPRAKDAQIRNLPIGQFQVLVTNNKLGTEFLHMHVRRPWNITLDCFEPVILPRSQTPNIITDGANLRFKDPRAVERRTRLKGRLGHAR
jgi:hypothetical protein